MNQPVVRVRDLHVTLGTANILRGIDLDVEPGQTLAVLGANGSGKSTLIRAIVGAIPHQKGSIDLFGVEVGKRTKLDWQKIGYAPQRVTAASGVPATAIETVMSGLVYGNRFTYGKGSKKLALDALKLVGLDHRAHESVQTFSGGQQQRVLIARALVRDPELLVLDEPFAGVDKVSRDKITIALEHLRERGTTIVLILHELYELEHMIDASVALDHGVIVARTSEPPTGVGPHAHPDHDHQHAHADDPPHYRTPSMKGAI